MMFYIFDSDGSNIGQANYQPDADDLAERGEFFVESSKRLKGLVIANPETQQLIERKAAPSAYHIWKNNRWTLTAQAKKQQLQDAKTAKLAELNATASKYIEVAAKISETPEFERATWTIQATEAIAWHADNKSPTPNLDIIAHNRGVPADILRQKAYEKAIAFEQLTATIAGQRQKIEDQIKAAATLADLEALTIAVGVA